MREERGVFPGYRAVSAIVATEGKAGPHAQQDVTSWQGQTADTDVRIPPQHPMFSRFLRQFVKRALICSFPENVSPAFLQPGPEAQLSGCGCFLVMFSVWSRAEQNY